MEKIVKYLKAMPLVVITAIICILCFTACGKEARGKLATPENLRIADEVLMWDAVENATGYEVDIDGKKYQTKTNSLDIFLLTTTPKTYNMRVLAYADINKYNDSEWSGDAEYAVDFPSGWGVRAINNGTEYAVVKTSRSTISGKLVIPSYFSDGKPITKISQNAFKDCENITSVVLSDTITEIESSAFANCASLTRVRLPWYLETISSRMFEGCEQLIGITLPRGIKKISDNAFSGCKSMTEIFIPDMVEYIDPVAFARSGITSITVDENNYIYKSDGNCIIEKDTDKLAIGCNGSVIPDYVREIKNSAFSGCDLLDRIEIPNSVTKIGAYAFRDCTALTEITVPGSVQTISAGTFAYCKSLKKVTLEDGVKSVAGGSVLGGGAFAGCTALESVQLPKTLESISPYAFDFCSSLKSIVIDEENAVLKAEGACIIQKADNELVLGCDYSVVPNYVKSIGHDAFTNCSFSRILIKDNKKPDSYYENDSTTLYLPEGLETIKTYAFAVCKKLIFANLPKSVVEVERDVFFDCDAFSSVIVGENLRIAGRYAFYGALIYTSLPPMNHYPDGWDYPTHDGILYGCEFGEENGQPYLISYTAKYYKDEDGVFCYSYIGITGINIPYRVGYEFMGFATEEGSNEVKYAVRFHASGDDINIFEYYYAVSSEEFREMNKKDGGTTLYAVWKPIEK